MSLFLSIKHLESRLTICLLNTAFPPIAWDKTHKTRVLPLRYTTNIIRYPEIITQGKQGSR